jgi:hypothetical protein
MAKEKLSFSNTMSDLSNHDLSARIAGNNERRNKDQWGFCLRRARFDPCFFAPSSLVVEMPEFSPLPSPEKKCTFDK